MPSRDLLVHGTREHDDADDAPRRDIERQLRRDAPQEAADERRGCDRQTPHQIVQADDAGAERRLGEIDDQCLRAGSPTSRRPPMTNATTSEAKLDAQATASGITAKQQKVAMTNGLLPVYSAMRTAGT